MSTRVHCPDSDALVSYLYGEFEAGDRPDRHEVARHLTECATCASEVASLGGVREQLSAWTTPEADLGFEVVQTPARPWRRLAWLAWPSTPLPAAAAAVLMLGAGLGFARLDVQYSAQGGLQVRTGWGHVAPPAAPTTPVATPQVATAQVGTGAAVPQPERAPAALTRADLAAFESQLRRELADSVRATTVGAGDPVRSAGGPDPALWKRVLQLVEESELRQQQNLQLRVTELSRDLQVRRQADLVQIEQGFGKIAGDNAQQRQLLNQYNQYLRNVSTTTTPPRP